jgi:hypothetical protein
MTRCLGTLTQSTPMWSTSTSTTSPPAAPPRTVFKAYATAPSTWVFCVLAAGAGSALITAATGPWSSWLDFVVSTVLYLLTCALCAGDRNLRVPSSRPRGPATVLRADVDSRRHPGSSTRPAPRRVGRRRPGRWCRGIAEATRCGPGAGRVGKRPRPFRRRPVDLHRDPAARTQLPAAWVCRRRPHSRALIRLASRAR